MKMTEVVTKIPVAISTLLFICVLNTYGQTKIGKEFLISDLDVLKNNLERIHPGLYTYSSKKQIDEWFASTKNNLSDSMDYIQFYKAVAPLNSVVKNGHSFVALERFKKSYQVIPIRLYKDDNSFFIVDSFKPEYKELIGKEVFSIDGVPLIEIFNNLLNYQTRDGDNLTFPTAKLLHNFNLDYSLIYGSKSSYEIVLSESTKQVPIILTSISSGDISFYKRVPLQDYFNFKIADSVAVLTFKTFEKSELKKIRYKKRLREAFTSIKANHVKHLIIDVRNNGGGDATPNQELISYLYDKEFRLFKNISTITRKIDDKKNYKGEGIVLFNTAVSWFKLKKISENYYQAKTKGSNVYLPKADNYRGQLYILTNGRSFSATGEFTSFIKHHRGAVFIGEEVGGNKYQNTSGLSYYLTLPNSKLRMYIPTILWELNVDVENDGHGVKPDYIVRNTITDELQRRDAAMDFALQLIKSEGVMNK
ncbi:MAG: hypothetical protein HOP30_10010 [Cyclobacteriaceae bacterium]|nr:hypothetical protein [Cyclobacteriaceae bacterium]